MITTKKMTSMAFAAFILLSGAVNAQESQDSTADEPRLPVTEDMVKQKLIFIGNLVTKSASVRLIDGGTDEDAKAELEQTRAMYRDAQAKMTDGDFVAADKTISEIVKLITATTRRLSKTTNDQTRAIKHVKSRQDTIISLMLTFDEITREEKKPSEDLLARRAQVESLLIRTQGKIDSGNMKEAVNLINEAYSLATLAMKELRDGDTLVRELNFANAKDEFMYETDRNDSHMIMLEKTLNEKSPGTETLSQILDIREEAEKLRADAEDKASGGDYESGIDILGKSTKLLIRAIRMGGNFIPG